MTARTSRGTARRASVTRLVAGALGLAFAATPAARAQVLTVSAGGFDVHRLVYYHGFVLEQGGLCAAATGTVRFGSLRLSADAVTGTLTGESGVPNVDVGYRTTSATLHLAVNSELFIGVRREGRRLRADAGDTYWLLRGWNVRFEPDFGIAGLRGVADVSLLSSSIVRDGPRFSTAVQAAMGVSFRPRTAPYDLRIAYRFERYDLARSSGGITAQRYEEFRGVVLEVGLRPTR